MEMEGGGFGGMNCARSDVQDVQCSLENCGLIVVIFHDNVANDFVVCNHFKSYIRARTSGVH